MLNVLFVVNQIPYPLSHGTALRVVNFAKNLGPDFKCFLAAFGQDDERLTGLRALNVFEDILILPDWRKLSSPRRFFRRDNWHLHTRFNPDFAATVNSALQEKAIRWQIDIAVAVLLGPTEFVEAIPDIKRVVDDYDCTTLTLNRLLKYTGSTWTPQKRLRHWIHRRRTKAMESRLADRFDLITTIAPPDRQMLLELCGPDAPVVVVPNGVDNAFLAADAEQPPQKRAIAFWGNLDFYVNAAAVEYFYREIYLPHLVDEDIEWHIIGNAPSRWMLDLASTHPGIVLPGFVDDLVAYLAEIPIMVNPMVVGSGLKNKVLEAFATGMGVVTTTMGVEALSVEHGVHCLIADDPRTFARTILEVFADASTLDVCRKNARQFVYDRFTWQKVGEYLGTLLTDTMP